MNRSLIATLLAAGFATAIPVAVAQTAAPQTKAQESRQGEQGRQAKRQFRLPSERIEARLAYLHTALKVTDAQKAQWENFAAVMRKHAREADKRVQERRTRVAEGSKRPQLNAIERMERRQQAMTVRAQRLSELIAAGKPLYAAFTPEQKQAADELLSRQGRGGHGRHGGARSRG